MERSRFGAVEAMLTAKGSAPERSSLAEMDALWDEAKRRERAQALAPPDLAARDRPGGP